MKSVDGMQPIHYDIVVIGSGPAGESAAMNSTKKGRRVALICDREQVGGNCAHVGTIPSKALRHCVKQVMQFNSDPLLREFAILRKPSFPQIMRHAARIIDEQVHLRSGYYQKNGIEIVHGTASFIDKHAIRLGDKGQLPPA